LRDVEAYMAGKRRGSALYNEIGDDPRHTAIVARYYSCNLESNAKKAEPHTTEGYSPEAEFDGFLRKDEAHSRKSVCIHQTTTYIWGMSFRDGSRRRNERDRAAEGKVRWWRALWDIEASRMQRRGC